MSIVDFEHVIAGWDISCVELMSSRKKHFRKIYLIEIKVHGGTGNQEEKKHLHTINFTVLFKAIQFDTMAHTVQVWNSSSQTNAQGHIT